MMFCQFGLYAITFVILGGLMTILTTITAIVILGKSGRRTYLGTAVTIARHEGVKRLFRHTAVWAYLILFSTLLAMKIEAAPLLFEGHRPFLWVGLAIIAAALSTYSLTWSVTHQKEMVSR
jgi:predicted ABC-type exoprotein transport system permease subunit